MIKYEVIDNFLIDSDFTKLRDSISPTSSEFVSIKNIDLWNYLDGQVKTKNESEHFKKVTDIELLNPIHDWYFGHTFMQGPYQSQALSSVDELLSQIDPLSVYRINANFTVQQEKRGRSFFHIDYDRDPLNNNISMFTSIFYINTTNGPTILEDGTEIECRANRLVTYPFETYHAAVLCTDQPYRIVINLNYFADKNIQWE